MARDDARPPGATFAAVFPSIMLPMFLAVVDQTIVASALPAIASSLGGVERVSWVVIAYLVSTTLAAPVYGQLRDRLGGRSMMIVALVIFMGSSLMCAISPSVELLAFFRVLQGLGGGGLMTLSQAMIGESVPPLERGRYQGYLAAIAVTSSTFGPLAGGYLTEHAGWRSIFLVNVPIGLLALALISRMKAKPASDAPWVFDMKGLGLFVAFIVPLLLAVEQVQHMMLSAAVWFAVLGGFSLWALQALIRHERAAATPLFDLDLLSQSSIWRSDAMAAFHGAALVSLVTFLPLFFHINYGGSAANTGLMLLPVMIGIGTGSMITGRAMSRTGLAMVFPSVGLIFAVFLLLILALTLGWLSTWAMVVLLLLIGLSMGTVMAVVQVTVQQSAGAASLGAAAASIQFSRSVGASIGTALVGATLFAALAIVDPEAARVFTQVVQRGPSALADIPADQLAGVQAAIMRSFSIAFTLIAVYAACALGLAWSHPTRHL